MINNKAREISATPFSDRQAQIENRLSDLHTSLPAIIVSFDAEARTVSAQPAIQRVFTDGEGLSGAINLPVCVDVPVVFPSGGGYEITFPVKEGDECLLVFSERCIDNWFDTGEPSPPADYRKHDLSDAFAIMGVRSFANKKEISDAGMKIGSDDNRIVISEDSIELGVDGATMTLTKDKLISSVVIHCPDLIKGTGT